MAEKDSVFLLPLIEADRSRLEEIGAKAANLGVLVKKGFNVPSGLVLTTKVFGQFLASSGLGAGVSSEQVLKARVSDEISSKIREGFALLGGGPIAVRSSGVEEDLPGASFAGQYETILDVKDGDAAIEGVRRCWASAFAPRVVSYRASLGLTRSAQMAVILQRMVDAEAAGVVFTSNPITGERGEVVVNAVRGLGERLVSGEASADQWIVRDGRAERLSGGGENAIAKEQAIHIAETARRVEQTFGAPQDIEWAASSSGELFILQARPITALRDQVKWESPVPGAWLRNFRLGEWLGEPVTPLFETWLLPKLEDTMFKRIERWVLGAPTPRPYHVVVNGWYFASVNFLPSSRGKLVWMLFRYMIPAFILHPRRMSMLIPSLSSWGMEVYEREWRDVIEPRYSAVVAAGESRVDSPDPNELIAIVDETAEVAGDFLYVLFAVAGSAWKPEYTLASFYNKHLQPRTGGSHQRLLQALGPALPSVSKHSVYSLDWYYPTLGDTRSLESDETSSRRAKAIEARLRAESDARTALQGNRRLSSKFEKLLSAAQHAAILREEQAPQLTLGWPLMRRAVLRFGLILQERGVIAKDEDVFFLTRDELEEALNQPENRRDLMEKVQQRRSLWLEQSRLSVPLQIGKMSKMAYNMIGRFESTMGRRAEGKGIVRGVPASPGRATGKVKIIRTPKEFEKLVPGEVLVAPATTPAWTVLFGRAIAIVTDTGSLMAHASLVAREFGIPAVVGTGNATIILQDGLVVTVDGNIGIIELAAT
jgi:pyruvate,water dikinase